MNSKPERQNQETFISLNYVIPLHGKPYAFVFSDNKIETIQIIAEEGIQVPTKIGNILYLPAIE